ncbi:trafficking protein particle complex subunit 1 isoform X2 [Antechinus flavipes]|uniref:trafficking protein particle complex subunit 1 isoform X2 n=1 Tax=Antechinus flavipes TaxID=38775 RepID=UPI0022369078|nr:trafficking protein particle complex subunit 1 isoform X2 [Antechinus flavipes]
MIGDLPSPPPLPRFSGTHAHNRCVFLMTVHNLYLFDRDGVCLHYSEWHRKKQAGIPKEEEYKLMYGMLFSIRSFVSKMSPVDMKDGFLAFQTSRYKLHYYETPTGVKVVMNTDLGVGPIRDVLHHIYSGIFLFVFVTGGAIPASFQSGWLLERI